MIKKVIKRITINRSTSFKQIQLDKLFSHFKLENLNLNQHQIIKLANQHFDWLSIHHKNINNNNNNLINSIQDLINLNKPLAYILGTIPFHPLPKNLLIRSPTLIPRPETEYWIGQLRRQLHSDQSYHILDIGTGSACIPLALCYDSTGNQKERKAVGVDVAQSSIDLATENITLMNMEHQVKIVQADLFHDDFVTRVKQQGKGFDIIVSNPPYITNKVYHELDASVKDWEDKGALVGSPSSTIVPSEDDGLVYYRRIVSLLDQLITESTREGPRNHPIVVFEVGEGQAKPVSKLLRDHADMRTEIWHDQFGIDRVVLGYQN
jgi:release factor glutamine methyltransferase